MALADTEKRINSWARDARPSWGRLHVSTGTNPQTGRRCVQMVLGPVTTYGDDRADAVGLMVDHIENVENGA